MWGGWGKTMDEMMFVGGTVYTRIHGVKENVAYITLIEFGRNILVRKYFSHHFMYVIHKAFFNGNTT